MIPPERSAAVSRGLREAFGVTELEHISRITGGAHLVPGLSHHRARIAVPLEDHHTHRGSYAPLHKHAGRGGSRCGAARLVRQHQRARFHLIRQIAHLFYTMVFLFQGSAGKPIDWSATVPPFRDYHRRMWAGEVDLADKDVKIVYGRVHWERLLQNVRQARYNEALRIVADRHAIP